MLIGIVGKPNVGKSTFFKALTMMPVEIANRPFVTIDANRGTGYVRVEDIGPEFGVVSTPRLGFIKGKWRFVPVDLMDVAGLVPGAHQGRGLGNKFLDDLRQADALIMVVDVSGSTDEEGNFIGQGRYNVVNDVKWLEQELDWWFYNILEKNVPKAIRGARVNKKPLDEAILSVVSGLNIKKSHIEKALSILGIENNDYDIGPEEIKALAHELRLVSKPILIAANRIDIDLDIAKENLEKLRKEFPDKIIVPTSGYAELILKELDKEGKISYIPGEKEIEIKTKLSEKEKKAIEFIEEKIFQEFGSTGVQLALDKVVFDLLRYIPVFPGGVNKLTDKEGRVLPDCFLLPEGSTVLDFAQKIHSDMADKFIKAIDVRTKKIIGKDYILKPRDVIQIIFGK